jgi:outer membrane protein insertion porin family
MIAALSLGAPANALSPSASLSQDPAQGPSLAVERVVQIDVEGNARWTADQIRAALGHQVGGSFDPVIIENGLERLWQTLKVRAEVLSQEVDGGLRLIVRVTELPLDLEPRFIGFAGVELEQIYEWAGLTEQSELYLHQVARIRQRLIESYRRDGYHFIQVDPRVEEDASSEGLRGDVIFRIIEGPQVHVDGYEISGNLTLPDTGAFFWAGGLLKLSGVELHGPRLFTPSGALFQTEQLDADLLSMREVYRGFGYLDAVVELESLDFNEDRSRVSIRVVVDEGPRYRVGSIEIKGVELIPDLRDPQGPGTEQLTPLLFDEQELLDLCISKEGVAFERSSQNADERQLRDFYGERGYLSHPSLPVGNSWSFLEPLLSFDAERAEVHVTYRIAQGREFFIREVKFAGAYHTRDRVLRRDVTVQPGQLADLKEIYRSLRRITSTGFFSDSRDPVGHREPTFRFISTGEEDQVDLEFILEEGRVVDAQLMGGVDSNDGLFGIVSLTMRNFDLTDLPSSLGAAFGEVYRKEAFHGAGQQLDMHISPGNEVSYSRVRFYEPDLFGSHYDRWSMDLEYSDRDRIYLAYNEGRSRNKIEIGHQLSPELSVFVGVEQQDVKVTGLDPAGDLPAALLAQPAETELVGALLNVRYRDLDRRMDPTDGVQLRWLNSIYTADLGGSAEFLKSHFTYDWYKPVDWTEKEDLSHSVHARFGAGYAKAFGESESIPYTERFFLGGYKTLRGFDFRGVGPNQGDTTMGGEALLNASFEYRLPLYSTTRAGTFDKVEMFRLILFLDAGVIAPEGDDLNFGALRASAGFGIGLTYPFPVVFNFGFPFEEGPGDREQVFSFSLFSN